MLTFAKQLQMWFQVRRASDEGATAVEYGLMVALIAGAIVAVVALLGTDLSNLFTGADNRVTTGTTNMNAP